jgi:hypothetical protein
VLWCKVFELFNTRGFTAIINDDLVRAAHIHT